MPATAIKEKPILFSGPMVRAILDGRKTQTRRIVKPQPVGMDGLHRLPSLHAYELLTDDCVPGGFGFQTESDLHRCPYGQPGDRLWVREAWASLRFSYDFESGQCDDYESVEPSDVLRWRQSEFARPYRPKFDIAYSANWEPQHVQERGFKWRPSIHMPRWASRLTLEIVSVRVERLQEISEADAAAEGVQLTSPDEQTYYGQYRVLWNKINGPSSWEANPWVWVVEFKREATNA
jgi:hypothetical protein